MRSADYREELMTDIGARAQSSGVFTQEAFFEIVTNDLVELGEIVESEYTPYKARGVRVDGHGGDPANNSGVLTILIVDYDQSNDLATLTATELNQIFRRGMEFLERSQDGRMQRLMEASDPAFNLSDMIKKRWSITNKVRFILLTNRLLSLRIDSTPASEFDGKPMTISVWDLGRLGRQADSQKSVENIEIDLLESFGERIPALKADVGRGDYQAYLAVMPASLLGAIYDKYGARLLEQNVRVFLQARGKVNRRIRDTISGEPEMFFAYNNGITATAENVDLEKSGDAIFVRGLHNFQIVNGGQTTASVHQAWLKKLPLDHVHVQMKLTVIPSTNVDVVVPKISEYANSQNKVSAIDFFSNHPFHRRVEEMSRRILAPAEDGSVHQTLWFYERARGQYQNERSRARTVSMRREFDLKHPRSQRFDKGELAKFFMPWAKKPHIVARGSQKNFLEFAKLIDAKWQKNDDLFGDNWFRQLAAKAILFRATERLVTKQDWYEGGGSRAKIVPYALYTLLKAVENENRSVDFDKIWKEQSASEEIELALVACAATANKVIYVDEAERLNRAEYAKLELCKNKVDESLPVLKGLDAFTIKLREMRAQKKAAVKERKVDTGIQAQKAVLNAGAGFWKEVAVWGRENKELSDKDMGILATACSIPSKLPSEKQSLHLLALVRKLNNNGARLTIDTV